MAKISFNHDEKFDLQLNQALLNERRLADIFQYQKIEKIERRLGRGSAQAFSRTLAKVKVAASGIGTRSNPLRQSDHQCSWVRSGT